MSEAAPNIVIVYVSELYKLPRTSKMWHNSNLAPE